MVTVPNRKYFLEEVPKDVAHEKALLFIRVGIMFGIVYCIINGIFDTGHRHPYVD